MLGQLLWEKAKDFLQKAFSVILIATIVVWLLQSFDIHFNMVEDFGREHTCGNIGAAGSVI